MGRTKQSDGSDINSTDGIEGNAGTTIGASANPIFASGTILIDPAAISGNEDTGSNGGSDGNATSEPIRKRRGRKPGSTNAKKSAPLHIDGVTAILLSSHAMLAGIMHPHMKIDENEAKTLATGISNVARHYDVGATEKTLDWCNLFMALGMVYGTRIVSINMDLQARKKAKAAKEPDVQDIGTFSNGQFANPNFVPGAGTIRNN